MKVIKTSDVEGVEAPKERFIGRAYVRQILNEQASKQVQIAIVTITAGARTKDHIHHTSDQILYVLEGKGILATADKQESVGPGTVIYIPAGERHWHGATPKGSFTHISILTNGESTHFD